MKSHYADVVRYAPKEYNLRLAKAIHPGQMRNESQFGKELTAHTVSLEDINKNIDQIGEPLTVR